MVTTLRVINCKLFVFICDFTWYNWSLFLTAWVCVACTWGGKAPVVALKQWGKVIEDKYLTFLARHWRCITHDPPLLTAVSHSIANFHWHSFLPISRHHFFTMEPVIPSQTNYLNWNPKQSICFWWGPRLRKEIGSPLNGYRQSKKQKVLKDSGTGVPPCILYF